ncbi:MAG: ATP-binding cassette domain-containing protein [Oscillospiraceae bacterium]
MVGGNGAGKSTMLKAICGICKSLPGENPGVWERRWEAYKRRSCSGTAWPCRHRIPRASLCRKKPCGRTWRRCAGTGQETPRQSPETCEVEALLDSHPYDLSGGEQQRAALAKVLLTEPRLLLLDEPTKGMDGFFKEKLARILEKLKAQGMTVVMVSHDVEFCAQYGDLISMFFDGQILTTAPPRRFFGQNSFYTTAANRMSRCMFQNAVTAEHVVAPYQRQRRRGRR